jgi:hypothetical protein
MLSASKRGRLPRQGSGVQGTGGGFLGVLKGAVAEGGVGQTRDTVLSATQF